MPIPSPLAELFEAAGIRLGEAENAEPTFTPDKHHKGHCMIMQPGQMDVEIVSLDGEPMFSIVVFMDGTRSVPVLINARQFMENMNEMLDSFEGGDEPPDESGD